MAWYTSRNPTFVASSELERWTLERFTHTDNDLMHNAYLHDLPIYRNHLHFERRFFTNSIVIRNYYVHHMSCPPKVTERVNQCRILTLETINHECIMKQIISYDKYVLEMLNI